MNKNFSAIAASIFFLSSVPQTGSASYLFPYLPTEIAVGSTVSGLWQFDLSEPIFDIDPADPRAARYQFSRTNPRNQISIEIAGSTFASTTQQLAWPSNTAGGHGVSVCECDSGDFFSIGSLGDASTFPYITDFPMWGPQRYGGLSTTMRFANGAYSGDALPTAIDFGLMTGGQGFVYGISPVSATGGNSAWEIYFDLTPGVSASLDDELWRGTFNGVVSFIRQTEIVPVPDPTGLHLPEPSGAPLFIFGLAAIGFLGRRRTRPL